MNIGFIGLGEMGAAIAANMLKGGHQVRVWNRSPGPTQKLAEQGATVVNTAAEAFAGEAVFSMLNESFLRLCAEEPVAIDRIVLMRQDDEQIPFRVIRSPKLEYQSS